MGRCLRAPYQCIRCNYTTASKGHMDFHFYKLKKMCPSSSNNIELTEEIKQHILINRVYIIPPPQPPHQVILNQTINYNNTVNNLISSMESVDKLTKYMTHQNMPLLEYGESIENTFLKQVEGLKKDPDNHLELGCQDALILDKENLLEVIDQVSSLAQEHCENLNIIYDKKYNKLKLYDTGKWDEVILMQGIVTLLQKIQESYFNIYESYLIRKIEFSSLCLQDKANIKEKLIEYYKFIGCFDISPYVNDKNESQIMYNEDDSRWDCLEFNDANTEIPGRYTNLYNKVRGETKTSEMNKIKRNIVEIIKKKL